jgi:NAD(P)-dependent dehydrogenase (short-subunit alcohol dehydrogenase family)
MQTCGRTRSSLHRRRVLSFDDFQTIFAVNVIGPFQMTRAAAPFVRRSGIGSIVNISSNAGLTGAGSSGWVRPSGRRRVIERSRE